MKEKSKMLMKRRQWLRPASSWGPYSAIHSRVEVSVYTGCGGLQETLSRNIDSTVTLTDCSNSISYDYSAQNDKEYHKHLKMMTKLIDELILVRTAWAEARGEVLKRGGWEQ